MVILWCEPKKLYGEIIVIECIVVLLVPSPRHLILNLLVFINDQIYSASLNCPFQCSILGKNY